MKLSKAKSGLSLQDDLLVHYLQVEFLKIQSWAQFHSVVLFITFINDQK